MFQIEMPDKALMNPRSLSPLPSEATHHQTEVYTLQANIVNVQCIIRLVLQQFIHVIPNTDESWLNVAQMKFYAHRLWKITGNITQHVLSSHMLQVFCQTRSLQDPNHTPHNIFFPNYNIKNNFNLTPISVLYVKFVLSKIWILNLTEYHNILLLCH